MIEIWSEKAEVRFGHVDRSDRLTLWNIFNFFQEVAISHAKALGAGRADLANAGFAWILSRLSVFVRRRPAFGETIELKTWPRGCEKLFALRDYQILDAESNVVVCGRAGWLVLDIEKRRPLRPQPVAEKMPVNNGIDAFPSGPAALGQRENPVKIMERTALYSDIDAFGHTNNARYIQWIQDATDMDILTNASQIRLDINYLSEALPGDTVELWAAPLSGTEQSKDENYPAAPGPAFAYEGRRPLTLSVNPGQIVFRAELYT